MALSDTFINTPEFQQAVGAGTQSNAHPSYDASKNQFEALGGQFNSMFQNLVGRAPTPDEAAQFYKTEFDAHPWEYADPNSQQSQRFRDTASSFISDNFQRAAQDQATQQLQAQQGQANDLGNLFRTQGNQAISNVESSLMDYQSRLFDKLRPNLITSLSAQGLLDTGGLNQAMAGSQADLANSVQPFLAQQRLNNEQQANAISFGGASAPYQYQQAQIMNQVPWLQQQGQGALQNGYSTFLTNLNFQNQMALQNNAAQLQKNAQPSFLRTFGQTAATSLGSNFNIPSYLQAMNGGKNGAAAAMA